METNLYNVALAGYRSLNPLNGGFPDEATKNTWVAVAQAMLQYVPESLFDSKTFIARAEAICEASRSEKTTQQDNVKAAAAALYQKLHPGLSAEAIYNYALVVNRLRDRLRDCDDHLIDSLIKLLELPSEVIEKIDSLPRELDGKPAWYPGGYPTKRLLSDNKHYLRRAKSAREYSHHNHECGMCRAHVPHFLCEGWSD